MEVPIILVFILMVVYFKRFFSKEVSITGVIYLRIILLKVFFIGIFIKRCVYVGTNITSSEQKQINEKNLRATSPSKFDYPVCTKTCYIYHVMLLLAFPLF